MTRYSYYFTELDYMMKLRAKQWKADTALFHVMMVKGTSVHVFNFKGRINDDRWTELGAKNDQRDNGSSAFVVEAGDYGMLWIDSFGSNTIQGECTTYCKEEEEVDRRNPGCASSCVQRRH
jgi:hypothetical protein